VSGYTKADLTIWGMTLKIMREEGGVRGLYRGLITTAVGVAPYVGINFAAYEFLRGIVTPPGRSSVWRKLSCGALAGACPSLLFAICHRRGYFGFCMNADHCVSARGRLNLPNADVPF
jgi:hypothetical protein